MTLHRVYQTSGSISARVIYRYENKGIDCGEMVITDGFWLSQKCMRKTNAAKREKKKNRVYVVTTTMRVKCSCQCQDELKVCAL